MYKRQFGEKAGKKIAKMLLDSKEGINFALTDKNLVKLGIPILRISEVRENVKAILKHTQINQEMLIEYNCNCLLYTSIKGYLTACRL